MNKTVIELAKDYIESLSATERGTLRIAPRVLVSRLSKQYPDRQEEIENARKPNGIEPTR